MSDQMEQDYRRDSTAARLFNDCREAIDRVIASPDGINRLSPKETAALVEARTALGNAAAHIVRVWD